MGDDSSEWADEKPAFPCQLITQAFLISRYGLTNAQFDLFVKASGYEKREFWTDAGWAWLEAKRREGHPVAGPEEFHNPAFRTPNHPVVGVNWYEAGAMVRFLNRTFRDLIQRWGGAHLPALPAGWLWQLSLPSETQRERAARHTDGREFPWGSATDMADVSNCYETGLGHTSAAGIFQNGRAECGALDLAGNDWEWCRTKWLRNYENYSAKVRDEWQPNYLEGPSARVLRGGAWGNSRVRVRCARRNGNDPDRRNYYFGFRVVCVGASARRCFGNKLA